MSDIDQKNDGNLTAIEVSHLGEGECGELPPIQSSALGLCAAKLEKASNDIEYATAHYELIGSCKNEEFLKKFNSTVQIEALEYDIHPEYIFKIKNSFQTRAIGVCKTKLDKAKNDRKFKLENLELIDECGKIQEIIKVNSAISLQALDQYNVPPLYAHEFYNFYQMHALECGIGHSKAVSFNQRVHSYLLDELNMNPQIKFTIGQIQHFAKLNQANAFLAGVPFDDSLRYVSDDSVEAFKKLKESYQKNITESGKFSSWLINSTLLIDNKWALKGLDLGFTIDQAIETKGCGSLMLKWLANKLSDTFCSIPFVDYVLTDFCYTTQEADRQLFLLETNVMMDHN
jgi:hypothetical protein